MIEENQVQIDVWSDYVCPFCYLEEPVFEQLRQEYGDTVQVIWRAFELRPDPIPTLDPQGEYLRTTWERAVYPMANERGVTLRLPPVQPRSRKALEAAEFARDRDCFEAMHHALFRAFFEDGLDLNNTDILLEVGASVSLDRATLRTALEAGQYTERVVSDQSLAHQLNISGVPALLIHQADEPLEKAVLLSGAQPYETVRTVVERVRHKAQSLG
ncbi:DsbA family protein [Trichocoleus sp. FACHB-262]|uniref:DsbA family oxidoreductase n=1 Tax=Trichocoleus sp. FACHB-262 TaxID=2692869 RepID=UPI00168357C9|nr:DsbA family oxidoreductase [Trichocoleus sp. FACHB-262]MBD2119415.1 DsbA family oxidoreductase [Trichocoleus sp. FACHB-262]